MIFMQKKEGRVSLQALIEEMVISGHRALRFSAIQVKNKQIGEKVCVDCLAKRCLLPSISKIQICFELDSVTV